MRKCDNSDNENTKEEDYYITPYKKGEITRFIKFIYLLYFINLFNNNIYGFPN
ncbi:hypothetical protein Catovirus_2_280 [Catovirus CTV1]|uniref:Uncharacterized protein n=1 Tax=Catovirus CTV1 TaxID=1977631 RepID=A0A1V0SCB7_9VIRU|nr:hypothetical protein Catovirus_2_280 [Catovirus CTV1]